MVYPISGLTESAPPFRCRILLPNGEGNSKSEINVPITFGLVSNVGCHEKSVPGKSGKQKAV